MDSDTAILIDGLAADSLAAAAFMMEIAVRMGHSAQNGEAWACEFILNLHARLDEHEKRVGQPDRFGWHEGARQRIDLMGNSLIAILAPSARPGS